MFLGDLGQFQGLSHASLEALGEGSAERSRPAGGTPSTSVPRPGISGRCGSAPSTCHEVREPNKFRKNPPCAFAGHALAIILAL